MNLINVKTKQQKTLSIGVAVVENVRDRGLLYVKHSPVNSIEYDAGDI